MIGLYNLQCIQHYDSTLQLDWKLNEIADGWIIAIYTGFPKKDVRFPKIKNIPDKLSDDKEVKII